jgi:hypothetical protein
VGAVARLPKEDIEKAGKVSTAYARFALARENDAIHRSTDVVRPSL